jgi:hypothetical protein
MMSRLSSVIENGGECVHESNGIHLLMFNGGGNRWGQGLSLPLYRRIDPRGAGQVRKRFHKYVLNVSAVLYCALREESMECANCMIRVIAL